MIKLPVLNNKEKDEVLMELQEIGVKPVVKRYCTNCQHNYTKGYDNPVYHQCNVFHGQLCSRLNPNHNCEHWIEKNEKQKKETDYSNYVLIGFVLFISFALVAVIF